MGSRHDPKSTPHDTIWLLNKIRDKMEWALKSSLIQLWPKVNLLMYLCFGRDLIDNEDGDSSKGVTMP